MKINTRLRLNTVISLGTVILILLSLVWSFREILRADRAMELADEMRKVAFERILLRDEYLLYQEGRAKAQWHAKSEALRDLLAQADTRLDQEEDKALLRDAKKYFEATFIGMSRVMEGRARRDSGMDTKAGFSNVELRQISQVFLKAYSLTDNINRLHESARGKATTARNRGVIIVLLFVLNGIIAIIINSTVIDRTLTKRVAALGKGVETIGAGDLDHRIAAEGDDELTALALASNEMAAKLKRSYTSVENLEKEITERKGAEAALRASEVRYRRLFETAKDGILILDARTGMVVDVNPFLIEMLGFSSEAFLGKKVWELGFFKDIVANQDNFAELQQKEYVRYEDMPLETADGRRIEVEFISNVYLVNHQKVIQCNIRNITERKRAEAALNRSMAELTRSNEELKQFAYIASHDLQEPLRMIASYLQLIERRYKGKLDKDADEFITFAVEGANRLQEMIIGLLAYSRVQTKGKPFEEVNSAEVLGNAVANLKLAIEESGALVTAGTLPVIRADAGQLLQVFQNLMGNAIKFRGKDAPLIHISAEQKCSEWVFSVKDNGVGIEPEYKEKVFDMFRRLHGREYPGVGIGLSLCRRIVERHKGRIWLESEAGQGTTFYFTIPMKEDEKR